MGIYQEKNTPLKQESPQEIGVFIDITGDISYRKLSHNEPIEKGDIYTANDGTLELIDEVMLGFTPEFFYSSRHFFRPIFQEPITIQIKNKSDAEGMVMDAYLGERKEIK